MTRWRLVVFMTQLIYFPQLLGRRLGGTPAHYHTQDYESTRRWWMQTRGGRTGAGRPRKTLRHVRYMIRPCRTQSAMGIAATITPHAQWWQASFSHSRGGRELTMQVFIQLSLSACSAPQRAWEGPQGSLATILCKYLSKQRVSRPITSKHICPLGPVEEHPNPSYNDLMTHIKCATYPP